MSTPFVKITNTQKIGFLCKQNYTNGFLGEWVGQCVIQKGC